jgi:hypothetical protein
MLSLFVNAGIDTGAVATGTYFVIESILAHSIARQFTQRHALGCGRLLFDLFIIRPLTDDTVFRLLNRFSFDGKLIARLMFNPTSPSRGLGWDFTCSHFAPSVVILCRRSNAPWACAFSSSGWQRPAAMATSANQPSTLVSSRWQ